jgi:ubiquitin C-terminal hydrolase
MDEVTQLLAAIELEIDIAKIFDETQKGKRYKIRGLICYYLKHYAAYFFSDKENVWISFDDVSVQEG